MRTERAGCHLAGQLAVLVDVPGARADQDPQVHAQRVAAGQSRRKGGYLAQGAAAEHLGAYPPARPARCGGRGHDHDGGAPGRRWA